MASPRLLSHFPHLVLSRDEQILSDGVFPDCLLNGGSVKATPPERLAVLEALRWPPLGAYSAIALAPPEEQRAFLAQFPLSDERLLDALKAIRCQRLVVTVARGMRVRQIRETGEAFEVSTMAPVVAGPLGLHATVAFQEQDYQAGRRVPLAPLMPETEYLVEAVGPWDGLMFEKACEEVPQMPADRARMVALAVVYSCLGEPFRSDGSIPGRGRGAALSRFVTFPKMIRGALWAAADREAFRTKADDGPAVVWRRLADAFVDVVRKLGVDFSTQNLSDAIRVPAPKDGKHWGAWLPPESWNRIRLQAVVLSRVQRLVRQRLLPKSGYRKRGYPAHRRLQEAWASVSGPRQRQLLRELRRGLKPQNYRLFRVALRGIPLTQVVARHGIAKTALSGRLHGTVIPRFFRTFRRLSDSST